MARYRTIKPEFFTSEQVADCSPTARLLFIGMWVFADDAGVISASHKSLKMQIFPADDISVVDINTLTLELETHKLLFRYAVDGKEYFLITGWHHQKIEKPTFRHPFPNGSTPTSREEAARYRSIRRLVDDPSATERSRVERSREEQNDDVACVRTREDFSPAPPKAAQSDSNRSLAHQAVRKHITHRLPQLGHRLSPEIDEWLEAGCDVELDILPKVDELIAQKRGDIGSFKFFTTSVLAAKAQRDEADAQWKRLEEKFK